MVNKVTSSLVQWFKASADEERYMSVMSLCWLPQRKDKQMTRIATSLPTAQLQAEKVR